jgi:uncharacterized protein (DUF1501 family)
MSITRRVFLRSGAMAIVGTTAIPEFLTHAAFGTESLGHKKKRLIVILQRGGADGLNIVVPHGEQVRNAAILDQALDQRSEAHIPLLAESAV